MRKIVSLVLAAIVVCSSLPALAQTQSGSSHRRDGNGVIKVYLCADPAANIEITCTVPAGKIWRVIAMQVTLVTDATVANRNVVLQMDDASNQFQRNIATQGATIFNQTASTTITYTLTPCAAAPGGGAAAAAVVVITGLCDPILGPGYRITTSTANRAAGDNYGAPVLIVEEWAVTSFAP